MLNSNLALHRANGVEPNDLCEILGVGSLEEVFRALHEGLDFIGMGSGGNRKDKDLGDVKKFLGRLLGLPVAAQNALLLGLPVAAQNTLYHYFFSMLQHSIAVAVKEGKYSDQNTLYHYCFSMLQHSIAVAVTEGKYSDQ
ncbi:hypothetical protein T484DRAFT_1828073, partial [Baffinella frigidus]